MIKAIYMPKLNSKSDQYFFGNCSKNSGDDVKKGRILLEVETDKVIRQVASQENGILKEQRVKTGQTVTVGELVATIEVTQS